MGFRSDYILVTIEFRLEISWEIMYINWIKFILYQMYKN